MTIYSTTKLTVICDVWNRFKMKNDDKLPVTTSVGHCCKYHWRGLVSIMTPILLLPVLIYGFKQNAQEYKCIYVVGLMAIFWITECLPLYVTGIFPVLFFPLFGILDTDRVCRMYFTDTLVMFVGGLILALAIEYSNLHHRLALGTILIVGCGPRRLLFGLIVITAFMSMWISNSATTAMMCPILKAVITELHEQNVFNIYMSKEKEPVEDGELPHLSRISMAFYIACAYASTIGGTGTLIGTGTNLTFKGIYETRFPTSEEKLDFPIFMGYTIPIVVVLNTLLLYISVLITHMGLFRPNSETGKEVAKGNENAAIVKEVIQHRWKQLGPMSCHEFQVALIFTTMIVLLFTRKPGFILGWGDFLNAKKISSSVPLMFCCLICFALPTNYACCRYFCTSPPFPSRTLDALLSWDFVHKNTPWGLCFLLGAGFALAEASTASGMAKMLGFAMSFASKLPHALVIFLGIVASLILTAFSSNVAVCNIATPIFCEMALSIKMHPLLITLPTALAMSFSYFLPVSTPPNAIITGYAAIKTKYLAAAGILPTFWAILLLNLNTHTWGKLIYPKTSEFPEWALEEIERKIHDIL